MKILILIIIILLIIFIFYWFFGNHKTQVVSATDNHDYQSATIVVKGGYSPSILILKKGIPAKISFNMQDPTACLSHVVFEKLGIDKDLTKQKITTIDIPTDKEGQFNYSCGMNMFHGKIIIK